ncbi:Ski complex subunit Rec14 [Ciborinia camelliae]|nr:Ski complex subunit Rec14 [Ciborinia camelliae]
MASAKALGGDPEQRYIPSEVAHKSDIFSLAVTSTSILSASGTSTIKIHSTTTTPPSLSQSLPAHKLGCHHICTSKAGNVAASAGFDGTVSIWTCSTDLEWSHHGHIVDGNKPGEVWALALSTDGRFLAGTTVDGKIGVWDLLEPVVELQGENAGKKSVGKKIREYETKGSLGLCVDFSVDGKFTASGHENGGVYVFNNDTGRMVHSLPGLVQPIRTLSFSPHTTYLAVAGDSATIALYSVAHGEQVANLTGHNSWIFSIDWNFTGEYLASGAWDGKVKVWSVETRTCVATHFETDKALWAVKWLPKAQGRSEVFVTAGVNRSLSFYREATGG